MSDEPAGGGLHIDSGWKEEAAREKEILSQKEQATSAGGAAGGSAPQANFTELINIIAMQAAVSLGGFQGPGEESLPPNPAAARHFIDLLEVLRVKTEGRLTDDENNALSGVLHELRLHFVQATTAPPPAGEEKAGR